MKFRYKVNGESDYEFEADSTQHAYEKILEWSGVSVERIDDPNIRDSNKIKKRGVS